MGKRLTIFGTPWHLAHNNDLMRALEDIADFDLLINYTRRWDETIRPLPKNARWVPYFEKGKYDLAILHIDQQCNNISLNKTKLTKHMKEAIKEADPELPIVFINHGTPVYPELYADGTAKENYVSETLRKEIMDIVGDCHMVVNSRQAAEEWKAGTPILHGIEANEWVDNKQKEPRVATFISIAGIGDKYYNRSFLTDVIEYLKENHGITLQWVNTPNCFNAKDIQDYKEFIGSTLIYFNPTYASPMPRSRTEAMLSGCCVITTPQHGAEEFIQDGVNGFLVSEYNVEYAGELIARLIKDYKIARMVGQNGRRTALQLFNRERYKKDWIQFIETELKIQTNYELSKKKDVLSVPSV